MRTPPHRRLARVPLLLALLLMSTVPTPAAAAPQPPAAAISWDGQLTLSISCPRIPDDVLLTAADGSELLPQPPVPADSADTWLLSFPLPPDSGPFLLNGCDGLAARELIIAHRLPLLPAIAAFGALGLLIGLLCRRQQQPHRQRAAPASGWDLAVWDGRQEWLVPFHGPSATLGHHNDCDIIINGPAVAARHARLVPEADGIRLIDLGHGATFVGPIRRRLRPGESFTLQSDEEIVLGTTIRIRLQRTVTVQQQHREHRHRTETTLHPADRH